VPAITIQLHADLLLAFIWGWGSRNFLVTEYALTECPF